MTSGMNLFTTANYANLKATASIKWPSDFTPWPPIGDVDASKAWFAANQNFSAWSTDTAEKADSWEELEICISTILQLSSSRIWASDSRNIWEKIWQGKPLTKHATPPENDKFGKEMSSALLQKSSIPWKEEARD